MCYSALVQMMLKQLKHAPYPMLPSSEQNDKKRKKKLNPKKHHLDLAEEKGKSLPLGK